MLLLLILLYLFEVLIIFEYTNFVCVKYDCHNLQVYIRLKNNTIFDTHF
jgi:hypothetical protein